MKQLFIPGIKAINKLKYPQKFGIVSFIIFFFITALLIIISIGLNQKINFLQKQRIGIGYVDPTSDLLHNMEEERGLLRISKLGINTRLKQDISQLEFFINRDLKQIKELNVKHNNVFGISDDIREISKNWEYLNKNISTLNEEKIFEEINFIIRKLYKLIIEIGDKSNLTLSPQIHTFYLVQSIIWDAPLLAHKIGKIRSIGSAALAKQRLTDDQRLQLLIYINFLRAALEDINENSDKIFQEKENLKNIFREPLLELNGNIQNFLSMTYEQFIENPVDEIKPEAYLSTGAKALRSTSELYHIKMSVLDELLQNEINEIKRLQFMIILPAFLILLAIAYIFSCFTFSVVNGVKYLQDKALKIADGDLSVKSELETEDELKDLSDSLNKMIFSLRNLLKREKITRNIIINALESTDVKKTLSTIVKNTAKLFDADRCFFVEYDAKNDNYLPIERHNSYISSLEIKDVAGMKLSQEEMQPVTDFVFTQKTVLAVDDVKDLQLPEKIMNLIEKCKIKSFMVAPLFYASVPIGLLLVESIKNPKKYEEEDIKLMETISYQSSIVIHQAKLLDQIRKKSGELEEALYNEQILRKITAESSLLKTHEEVDNYVLNELMNIFKVSRVVHLHVDRNSLRWYGRKITGEESELLEGQCFVPADSAGELIPSPEEVLVFSDTDKEIQNAHLKHCLQLEKIDSLIAYPTSKKFPGREDKGVIEVTIIADSFPRTWKEEEKNLFRVIMDTLSIVTLETIQRRELEEVRKTFVSTLTHDLRSPLLAEQKALEFLLSPKGSKVDVSEYLEDLYKTNEDLLKLINNLLSTYHYESGKWRLNKTQDNIEDITKKVIKTLQPLAKERDAEIIQDMHEVLPPVLIDVVEIKRVLMNLISNAIKHNEKGVKVTVGARKKENNIEVFVNDNGKGISPEVESKIFERFLTQKGKIGAGLGLYISKQIIEAHEGKIWFDTKEGEGTTFYFTLPL